MVAKWRARRDSNSLPLDSYFKGPKVEPDKPPISHLAAEAETLGRGIGLSRKFICLFCSRVFGLNQVDSGNLEDRIDGERQNRATESSSFAAPSPATLLSPAKAGSTPGLVRSQAEWRAVSRLIEGAAPCERVVADQEMF